MLLVENWIEKNLKDCDQFDGVLSELLINLGDA
jgi:hypothetical protein